MIKSLVVLKNIYNFALVGFVGTILNIYEYAT